MKRLDLTDLLPIGDVLLARGAFRFRVASGSMAPTLRRGDRITVEPVALGALEVGSLVLFHDRGRLVCHRLVATRTGPDEPRFLTKGDAATACDVPLRREQILGRVVGVRRRRWWIRRPADWIDGARQRVAYRIVLGFASLQDRRPYRRLMRRLLSGAITCRAHVVATGRLRLVARVAGLRAGGLGIEEDAAGSTLRSLRVRLPFRRLGVGSRLLALAATLAADALLVSVEPENTAAVGLFTKLGFRQTGERGEGRVLLRRDPS